MAGDAAAGRFLALIRRDRRLWGAFGLDAPRWVMAMRAPLLDAMSWDDAIDHAVAATS